MPGRKKTPVATLFHPVGKTGKMLKVRCNFCSLEMSMNGTRMAKHIAACKKCDEQIKAKYLGTFCTSSSNDIENMEEIPVNEDTIEISESNVNEQDATASQEPQTSVAAALVADVHQIHSTPIASDSNPTVSSREQQPSVASFFPGLSSTPIKKRPTSAQGSTEINKSSSGSSFYRQTNKMDQYMDNMSDGQIVSKVY